MIELGGYRGHLSIHRRQHPRPAISTAPWVGASQVQVSAEVSHLLIGERRIEVPRHGRVILAWKSVSTGSGGIRPIIIAVGHDGLELSSIGPRDSMDSYTLAKLKTWAESDQLEF